MTILPFVSARRKGWSQAEHEEFVRATMMLRSTGLPVVTETGLSDEGDPWTIFLREDTGDVVVHICKIDGRVVAASAASEDVVSGPTFRAVMDRIIRSQPLVLPATRHGDKVLLHPSAVVTAFIATALAWSYSEEASIQQYDWKVAADGTVQPNATWARNTQSSSILRDAVLSKVDAANGGLENATSLSSRFVLAASVAAIAIVAELVTKLDMIEESQALAGESQGGNENPDADRTASLAPTGVGALTELASYASGGQPRISGLLDDEVAVAVNEAPSSHPGVSTGSDSSLPNIDISYQSSRLLDPGSVVHTALDDLGFADPGFLAPLLPRAENLAESGSAPGTTSREIGGELTPALGAVASLNPAKLGVSHILLSADAVELLASLFSPKELAGTLDLHGASGDVTSRLTFDMTRPIASQNVTPSEGLGLPDSTRPPDSGYKLIEDILAFAFDPSREISASRSTLENFSHALKANSFLPSADRVLIIDVPDLRADAFRFTDGVVMISQDLAAQLLPDTPLQPQSELGTAGGATLRLIGVIDMTAASHVYAA